MIINNIHQILIVTRWGVESCLPFITLADANQQWKEGGTRQQLSSALPDRAEPCLLTDTCSSLWLAWQRFSQNLRSCSFGERRECPGCMGSTESVRLRRTGSAEPERKQDGGEPWIISETDSCHTGAL